MLPSFLPSILPLMETPEGSFPELLGLKLGENWIFIFWPVGKVKSGRSNWDLFILWVHDQFMQVFNGKKIPLGSSKSP